MSTSPSIVSSVAEVVSALQNTGNDQIVVSGKTSEVPPAIDIDGGVTTHGEGIAPLELHGVIGQFGVNGGVAMTAAKES